tara:strand:+ start:1439 stop:1834 length:396 start_codon:yes stop_codon:yes gene_type:complete
VGQKNSDFDLDLQYGQIYEEGLKVLLESKGKVEVKTERDKWYDTGNMAIEVKCNGKKSGLAVTKADWWFHIFAKDGQVKGMLCLPVSELKNICRGFKRNNKLRKVMGGDGDRSELLLLPIKEVADSIGKYF